MYKWLTISLYLLSGKVFTDIKEEWGCSMRLNFMKRVLCLALAILLMLLPFANSVSAASVIFTNEKLQYLLVEDLDGAYSLDSRDPSFGQKPLQYQPNQPCSFSFQYNPNSGIQSSQVIPIYEDDSEGDPLSTHLSSNGLAQLTTTVDGWSGFKLISNYLTYTLSTPSGNVDDDDFQFRYLVLQNDDNRFMVASKSEGDTTTVYSLSKTQIDGVQEYLSPEEETKIRTINTGQGLLFAVDSEAVQDFINGGSAGISGIFKKSQFSSGQERLVLTDTKADTAPLSPADLKDSSDCRSAIWKKYGRQALKTIPLHVINDKLQLVTLTRDVFAEDDLSKKTKHIQDWLAELIVNLEVEVDGVSPMNAFAALEIYRAIADPDSYKSDEGSLEVFSRYMLSMIKTINKMCGDEGEYRQQIMNQYININMNLAQTVILHLELAKDLMEAGYNITPVDQDFINFKNKLTATQVQLQKEGRTADATFYAEINNIIDDFYSAARFKAVPPEVFLLDFFMRTYKLIADTTGKDPSFQDLYDYYTTLRHPGEAINTISKVLDSEAVIQESQVTTTFRNTIVQKGQESGQDPDGEHIDNPGSGNAYESSDNFLDNIRKQLETVPQPENPASSLHTNQEAYAYLLNKQNYYLSDNYSYYNLIPMTSISDSSYDLHYDQADLSHRILERSQDGSFLLETRVKGNSLSANGSAGLADKTDIIILLDCSNSMGWAIDETGLSRLKASKQAISSLINLLTGGSESLIPNLRIGLIAYAGSLYEQAPYTTQPGDILKVLPNYTRGGTFTQAGLHHALKCFAHSDAANKLLIHMTDGDPTNAYALEEGMEDIEDIRNLSYNYEKTVRKYTIEQGINGVKHETAMLHDSGVAVYNIGMNLKDTDKNAALIYDAFTYDNAKYYPISDLSGLNEILSGFANNLTYKVNRGRVVLPIPSPFVVVPDANGEYFSYQSQLQSLSDNTNSHFEADTQTISIGNITLDEGDEIIIQYRVRFSNDEASTMQVYALESEKAINPYHFFPVSPKAYLHTSEFVNGEILYFASPLARISTEKPIEVSNEPMEPGERFPQEVIDIPARPIHLDFPFREILPKFPIPPVYVPDPQIPDKADNTVVQEEVNNPNPDQGYSGENLLEANNPQYEEIVAGDSFVLDGLTSGISTFEPKQSVTYKHPPIAADLVQSLPRTGEHTVDISIGIVISLAGFALFIVTRKKCNK